MWDRRRRFDRESLVLREQLLHLLLQRFNLSPQLPRLMRFVNSGSDDGNQSCSADHFLQAGHGNGFGCGGNEG